MAAAHAHWSSRFAFIMAAVGSAVGLGNLWRFPFQTGQNGGSAFVLVYLACVIFIAFPILMSELAVGRHAQLSAVGSTRKVAHDAGRSGRWSIVGWVGMIGGFLVLTTYSVIAGQVMAYSAMGFMGEFSNTETMPLYDTTLDGILWHSAFMALTVFVVAQGVKGGIERVVTILMPLFFVMLAGLCVYAMATGAAAETISYLFAPRFDELRPQTFIAALGQAFFSIGVGSAIMITYGSYLNRDANIGESSGIIATADTLVALVAGMMIFPIVFMVGLDPAAGAGLIFGALPEVFSGMPFGNIIGGAFFFLAFIAALTSSISLLEATVAFADEHTSLTRFTSAAIFGGFAWFIGVGAIYSPEFGSTFLDVISGEIALPLAGLLVAIFAGWVVPRSISREELSHASNRMYGFWRFTVRYPVPLAVIAILVFGLSDRFGWGITQLVFGG